MNGRTPPDKRTIYETGPARYRSLLPNYLSPWLRLINNGQSRPITTCPRNAATRTWDSHGASRGEVCRFVSLSVSTSVRQLHDSSGGSMAMPLTVTGRTKSFHIPVHIRCTKIFDQCVMPVMVQKIQGIIMRRMFGEIVSKWVGSIKNGVVCNNIM